MTEKLKPGLGFISNTEKLPDGAIPISGSYLYQLQGNIIDKWQPEKEMFPLKHGSEMLGILAAINGCIFTNHFRYYMGLRSYARLISYAPTIVLPTISVVLLHQSFVTYRMAIGYLPCVTCAEVRSITIQSLFGFVNPFLLSVLGSFAMAKLSTCYPLPPFSDYKSLFKSFMNLAKKGKSKFLALYVMNLLTVGIIDYRQRNLIEKVNLHLLTQDVFIETEKF